ncbi:hypothetical protein MHYP_G00127180 [Metynnis hypsauchen]
MVLLPEQRVMRKYYAILWAVLRSDPFPMLKKPHSAHLGALLVQGQLAARRPGRPGYVGEQVFNFTTLWAQSLAFCFRAQRPPDYLNTALEQR